MSLYSFTPAFLMLPGVVTYCRLILPASALTDRFDPTPAAAITTDEYRGCLSKVLAVPRRCAFCMAQIPES